MTEAKLPQKLRRVNLFFFSYKICFTNHTSGEQTFYHPCPSTLPLDKTEHHKVSDVVNKVHVLKRVECDAASIPTHDSVADEMSKDAMRVKRLRDAWVLVNCQTLTFHTQWSNKTSLKDSMARHSHFMKTQYSTGSRTLPCLESEPRKRISCRCGCRGQSAATPLVFHRLMIAGACTGNVSVRSP